MDFRVRGNDGGQNVSEALTAAARAVAPVSDTPRLDAELLMAHALRISREELLLRHLSVPVPPTFRELVARRRELREPVAYITGSRGFWTLDLAIGPGALIPRPDSETLISAAIAHFAAAPSPTSVLDLGTGSGALLLAALAEWPQARGLGIDRSAEALHWARINLARHAPGRVALVQADWEAPVSAAFDLVLCNPPYVETGASLAPEVAAHEPAAALFAGPDGLDAYRTLAPRLSRLIAPGGCACIEIGASQAAAVSALFATEKLASTVHRDLAGRDRCLLLTG